MTTIKTIFRLSFLLFFIILYSLETQAQTFPYSIKSATGFKTVNGVSIPVPPKVHPRLYINSGEVAGLEARLKHPALETIVTGMQKDAVSSVQMKIEWDAIQYLIHGDVASGRSVIDSSLSFLKRTTLGTQGDAARETGRAMVTGALVYDWLYDLITPSEKKIFIQELVRLAKTLECGYPPTRQGSVTGHSSESFIMCDMLSAGIAIYDEFPEMYELAAARFFGEHLPARNWLYNGHAYHQGDSYGPSRFSWDTYPLMIFDRMGVNDVYNPEQRYVPYFYIYSTRPDGSLMRAGDTFLHNFNKPGDMWPLSDGALFTASYYGDGVIMDRFINESGRGVKAKNRLFLFLWWDVELKPVPLNTLPLSRYFGSPFGWMIARTGWDENAVIAEMKINEYNFANHQHLDAGAFQIYYRGPLAVESGLYTGTSGGYGSSHNFNYYKRTIAHNSLLVYDPNEQFREQYCNDGGQRLPNGRSEPGNLNDMLTKGYKTGTVLAQDFGADRQSPDYTYLKGDITEAYSSKVSDVKRSFVFLNLKNKEVPAALIIYDKVVSSDPSFKKFWLLHSIDKPVVQGNETSITLNNGRDMGKLINTSLIPGREEMEIETVGGPGKEFWVFGTNYPNEDTKNAPGYERAAWRIELSPRSFTPENYFLNVMQILDNNSKAISIEGIDEGKLVGVAISDRIVLFSKTSEFLNETLTLSVNKEENYKILITDMGAGVWDIYKDGNQLIQKTEVKSGSGVLYFEVTNGTYTIQKFK
jgi:hypothetical protein